MIRKHIIPLMFALVLPLASCTGEQPVEPADVKATEILEVHAPANIEQNKALSVNDVELVIAYDNGTTNTHNPDSVTLSTATLGQAEGIAYYLNLFKKFTINVTAPEPSEKTFDQLKSTIVNQHNYTIEVESYYKNFPSEKYEGFMANINDEVYYGTDPEYPNLFISGYSKVKDQGIVDFTKGIDSNEIVINQFVSTNPNLGISDIHGGLIEYIFASNLTLVEENHYKTTDQELVGIAGSFTNLELAYVSNPDHIDIYKQGNNIKIECILTANYYDPETLEPVENEPINVYLTIKNIGTTHDDVVESFAHSDSSKAVAPTRWDAQMLADFLSYYNEYIPAFPEGLSYSFHHSTHWNGYDQRYEIKGEDLASGDLRASYIAKLAEDGYASVETNIYERRVNNTEGTLCNIYRVEFKFYSPSEPYGGATIGYFYPKGVFQFTFTMRSEVIATVNSVASFNSYADTTRASNILPRFPSKYDACEIKNFDDRTEIANQLAGEDAYLFTTGTTGYFKIYIASYEDALEFYDLYLAAAAEKGLDHVESMAAFHLTYISDEADSKITISYVGSFSKEDYEAIGYIQCQIVIRNNYVNYYQVDFTKDAGVGSVQMISPSNFYHILPGETVTFSFSIENGYDLDKISCSDTSVVLTPVAGATNKYSFTMPDHNVIFNIVTKSSAHTGGLEYGKEYSVYIDNSNNLYNERPSAVCSKLSLTFDEDGTGTYKRIRYNSSGTETGGPYEVKFNYTLINGQFNMTYLSGDNTDFSSWRLFTYGGEDEFNNTGTFANDTVSVSVVNSQGVVTVTLVLA